LLNFVYHVFAKPDDMHVRLPWPISCVWLYEVLSYSYN